MKNIFDHSESWGIGAIYANQKSGLQICYYDIGIGIMESVRKHKSIISDNDMDILNWALLDGNSSKDENNNNHGRGFTVIKKFIKSKHGILSIRTGRFHRLSDGTTKTTNWFPGTQIVMYLNMNL